MEMNVFDLQQQLASKLSEKESRELLDYITNRPDTATKSDVEMLRKDIDNLAKIWVTEAQMEKAIGNLAWKVAGFLVAQAAVIVTLVKLL